MDWDLIQGAKKYLAGQFVLNNLTMEPKHLGRWGMTWLTSLPQPFQNPARLSLQRKIAETWPFMSPKARTEFFQSFPDFVPDWAKRNLTPQFPAKPPETKPPHGPGNGFSPAFPPQIPPNPREGTY